jgi:hypothetical protein
MPLVIASIEEWSQNVREIGQQLLSELKQKMWITWYGHY